MATLRLSDRPTWGIVSQRVDGDLLADTVRLAPDDERQWPRQVPLGERDAVVRGGTDQFPSGLAEGIGHHPDDDREVEQRARRRPHHFRVERVDRPRGEYDAIRSCRLGRAQDRAEVARIRHARADHHERRRCRQRRQGRRALADDAEHWLRRLRGCHPLQHARRKIGHGRPRGRRRAFRRGPRTAPRPPSRRRAPRRAGRCLRPRTRRPPNAHCGARAGAAVVGPVGS